MIKNNPTYISLFSSAGVGCFGFKEENFECIATNEIIERRLKIQKINKKCKYESGYIGDDIRKESTKNKIYDEIERWRKLGNDRVDVVIATPPCQGMSVANHKKNSNDVERNGLIKESVEIVKKINPRFFVFENVAAFWKTGCVNNAGEVVAIGHLIMSELGEDYLIHNEILNFKNYGSNSSRTRTLVIGVHKEYSEQISPVELMPDFCQDKTLRQVIGHMKSLEWGSYDPADFFHSFRVYPIHMRKWIDSLSQGESAFDNVDDIRKPHKIVNGEIVLNKSKNGDKYKRQIYDKVAPCIHTRNDQMASQNTIHPIDDRVFSIRELMLMMTIPNNFKWIDADLEDLNSLDNDQKKKLSRKEEMNIRQSIGEAVPTIIFKQIASKIRSFLLLPKLTEKQVKEAVLCYNLEIKENIKDFIRSKLDELDFSTLSMIVELSNSKRQSNSAYFTNKSILQSIFEFLPGISKDSISIIEPSVGSGNFLPFIFKKYADKNRVDLTVIDVDQDVIDLLKILYSDERVPSNFRINFVCADYMSYKHDRVDLIIGNPPFTKINGEYRKELLKNNENKESTNLAEFMLEKALKMSDYVSFIMPKNLLNTPEYEATRKFLSRFSINSILDFGEKGFKGVLVETINLIIDTNGADPFIEVFSITNNKRIKQKKDYIFSPEFPYWVIYRNDFFDQVYKKMDFGVFDVFRDRQITNNNTFLTKDKKHSIRVLKSRNILDSGEIVDIENYDSFIDRETLSKLSIGKFLDETNVYLTPNMTYKPRLIKKGKGYVVNGSVAILIPKSLDITFSQKQLDYISSEEFRKFYKIARNYQTRSLNVDKCSVYWFGIEQNSK